MFDFSQITKADFMGGLWILDLMIVIVSVIGILVMLFHFKKGRIGKKN